MNRIVAFPFAKHSIKTHGGLNLFLMEEFLNCLPIDAKFVGAFSDATRNIFCLVFESNQYASVPTGARLPEAEVIFRKHNDGTEYLDCIKYENGVIDKPRLTSPSGSIPVPINTPWPGANPNKSSCLHDWKDYYGVNDHYRYCAHCGVKDQV